MTRRRACGFWPMSSLICPCRTKAGDCAPEAASANNHLHVPRRASRPFSR
jgi:hypothetical protein